MPHPLVDQLRFTRSEWSRGLAGVSKKNAARHFGPMNCISWLVGHLAWHEQKSWLERAQGKILFPQLNELFATGAPMSTSSLKEMLDMWNKVTKAVDPYLNTLTTETLQNESPRDGKPVGISVGSTLRRITYHYWFHIGEIPNAWSG